jgi:hypothetical protein
MILLAAALITVATFQNCSPGFSGSASMPSTLALNPAPVPTPALLDIHDQSHQDRPVVHLQEREKSTASQDVIGDRRFVRAMFRDVFGDGVLGLANSIAFRSIGDFGGNCSTYERYMIASPQGILVGNDASNICLYADTAEWMTGSVLPKFTVKRGGLLSKACEGAVMDRVGFPNALSKIGPRLGPSAVPEVNSENLKNLALLFYRNHGDPPTGVIEAFRVFFTPGAPTPDEWRAAIFTVCVSSHWQVI